MKLQLFIRNELLIENEIEMPEWKILLRRGNEKREEIMQSALRKFKVRNESIISQNEGCEIFASVESNFEEAKKYSRY